MHCKNENTDLLLLVKSLNKLLKKDFDKRLNEFDLTAQQGRALFFISYKSDIEKIEVHQNDVEKEFGLSKSTVSGLIKRLEKKELIHKESFATYYILKPTDKGRNIIAYFHDNRIKVMDKLTQGFSKDEKDTITKYLKILINNMEKEE